MNCEKSCGAVVFTKTDGELKYLLITSPRCIYGFPKGHTEGSETETETALREVHEETGLKIRLLDGFRTADEYLLPVKKNTVKQVIYFLGTFEDQEIICQKEEVSGAYLVSYPEAMKLLRFDSAKRILTEANNFLQAILT